MKDKKLNIGIEVEIPSKSCTDRHCPFHSGFNVKGRSFTGCVVKPTFHSTTTIEFPRKLYLRKYERYETRRTRIKIHVPQCMDIQKGDVVRAMETRPISKTKSFVAVEITKK